MPVTPEVLGKMLLKDQYTVITQRYLAYLKSKGGFHPGIDYRARTPLKVYSPVEGVFAGTGSIGRLSIKIKGTNSYFIFLHLSKFAAFEEGALISVGTEIGLSGSAGTTKPHLHVEARLDSPRAAPYFKSPKETGRNLNPTSVVNAVK